MKNQNSILLTFLLVVSCALCYPMLPVVPSSALSNAGVAARTSAMVKYMPSSTQPTQVKVNMPRVELSNELLTTMRKDLFAQQPYTGPRSMSGGMFKANRLLMMSRQQAAQILGVGDNASEQDVVRAYKRAAARNHPDVGGSDAKMVEINEAKSVLLTGRSFASDNFADNPHYQQAMKVAQFMNKIPRPVLGLLGLHMFAFLSNQTLKDGAKASGRPEVYKVMKMVQYFCRALIATEIIALLIYKKKRKEFAKKKIAEKLHVSEGEIQGLRYKYFKRQWVFKVHNKKFSYKMSNTDEQNLYLESEIEAARLEKMGVKAEAMLRKEKWEQLTPEDVQIFAVA